MPRIEKSAQIKVLNYFRVNAFDHHPLVKKENINSTSKALSAFPANHHIFLSAPSVRWPVLQ